MTNDKIVSAQKLSTDAFPDRMRLAAWRAFVAQSAGACDAEPLNDQPFRVDSMFFGLPDVGIMFTQRSDSVIQCYRMTSDPRAGVESVSLSVMTHGCMSVVQGGREVSASAIDGLVFSAPGRVEVRDGFETAFINLPVASVCAAIPGFDPRLPALIAGETGAMRRLALYARVVKECPDALSGALARSISDHLFDLAILALGARGDAREAARRRGGAAAQSLRVLREIDARVADPALSLATVAGFVGLPEAEVRGIFDGTGEVFAERLEARRLDLALQRLRSSEWDHLSTAEIARRSGFADLSSFRRSFRARFGCMPSVARGRVLN